MNLANALKRSPNHSAQIENYGDVVTVDGSREGFYKVTVDGEPMGEIDSLEGLADIIDEYGLPTDKWYPLGQK